VGTGGDIAFTLDGTHAQFIGIPRGRSAQAGRSARTGAAIGVNSWWPGWARWTRAAERRRNHCLLGVGAESAARNQLAKARGCRVIGSIGTHGRRLADRPADRRVRSFDGSTVERVKP